MTDALDDVSLPIPRAGSTTDVLGRAADACARGVPAVLATVLARRGSAPSTPGQKLVLTAEGTCVGTVGGGAIERAVLGEMVALLGALGAPDAASRGSTAEPFPRAGVTAGPRTASFNLGPALGMCCGGGVEVLLEPLPAAAPVLMVGAGHVATALAPLLTHLGFAVTVCDEREAWADASRLPAEVAVVAGSYRDAGRALPRRAAVLVMTHDHALDQDAIEWALRERFAFVGGVGSRAKIARTRARLEARGFAHADIARVRMPLGVAIGARTPEEIAVSIAAEMVAWRRGLTAGAEARSGARDERATSGGEPTAPGAETAAAATTTTTSAPGASARPGGGGAS